MGCSIQKRPNEPEKKALRTNYNTEQIVFQNEMPDSNREILIQIKKTTQSKGMVHKYKQLYPDRNLSPDIDEKKQQGNVILHCQNVSKSLILDPGAQRISQKANSDYSTSNKDVMVNKSQNLKSLLKSNMPQVSKEQKNVTFQLKRKARSPMSDKQLKKQKVTIEHLEKIFCTNYFVFVYFTQIQIQYVL